MLTAFDELPMHHANYEREVSGRAFGIVESLWLWRYLRRHQRISRVVDVGSGWTTFLLWSFSLHVRPLQIWTIEDVDEFADRTAEFCAKKLHVRFTIWRSLDWVSWSPPPDLAIVDCGGDRLRVVIHLQQREVPAIVLDDWQTLDTGPPGEGWQKRARDRSFGRALLIR